jgi:hypothetical protein
VVGDGLHIGAELVEEAAWAVHGQRRRLAWTDSGGTGPRSMALARVREVAVE